MTMLYAPVPGALELRKNHDGSRTISGRFPYNSLAVLDSGGDRRRPRKERFASKAFSYAIDKPDFEVTLLFGHSFDRPLATKLSHTLKLKDTEAALTFDAEISPEAAEISHVKDVLAMLAAGLIGGISPGFRVPPKSAVPDAEEVTEEDPAKGRALIRTIKAAVLYELSLVVRPAYPETQVEARNWTPAPLGMLLPRRLFL